MARKRDPRRDEAFQIWKQHDGKITNRAIAEQLDVPEKTIGGWKSKDKWNGESNGVLQSKIRSTPKEKKQKAVVVESGELNDRQQLFCLYYLKYFNATKAYQKVYECAYSTAMANGYKMLRNAQIIAEIDRMKEERTTELRVGVRDVLQKYIDIAFSDITDYLKFGREDEVVYDENGSPKIDANGNVKMSTYSFVHLNDVSEVDGTLLTEVKEGREGISIKLADKMKALEMLSKYFDLLSDNDKKRLQEEKLKAETAKVTAEAERISKDYDEDVEEIVIVDAWSDGHA